MESHRTRLSLDFFFREVSARAYLRVRYGAPFPPPRLRFVAIGPSSNRDLVFFKLACMENRISSGADYKLPPRTTNMEWLCRESVFVGQRLGADWTELDIRKSTKSADVNPRLSKGQLA